MSQQNTEKQTKKMRNCTRKQCAREVGKSTKLIKKCKYSFKKTEPSYIVNTNDKGLEQNNCKVFCRFVKNKKQVNI